MTSTVKTKIIYLGSLLGITAVTTILPGVHTRNKKKQDIQTSYYVYISTTTKLNYKVKINESTTFYYQFIFCQSTN